MYHVTSHLLYHVTPLNTTYRCPASPTLAYSPKFPSIRCQTECVHMRIAYLTYL